MMSCYRAGVLAGLSAAGSLAQAESPPIQPGLWEVTSRQEVDGKPMPQPMDRLKNLPPAVKAQMEAQMRQRGVDMASDGTLKVCHTAESLAQDRWKPSPGSRCQTERAKVSSQRWTWHSVCKDPDVEGDGVATFTNPRVYTVTLDMRPTSGARAGRVMHMVSEAKWVGADCGKVQPMKAPAEAGAPRTP